MDEDLSLRWCIYMSTTASVGLPNDETRSPRKMPGAMTWQSQYLLNLKENNAEYHLTEVHFTLYTTGTASGTGAT